MEKSNEVTLKIFKYGQKIMELKKMGGKVEIIDGVIAVHTGRQEDVYIFDENGNEFLSNYATRGRAEIAVAFYQRHGIETVIGQKAPYQSGSKLISNTEENAVGVYIVPDPDFERKIRAISSEDREAYAREYQEYISEHEPHAWQDPLLKRPKTAHGGLGGKNGKDA